MVCTRTSYVRPDRRILAVDPSWSLDYDAFNKSIEMGVFIKDLTGNYPYLGQVWPGSTHVPDNATAYWTEQRAASRPSTAFEST